MVSVGRSLKCCTLVVDAIFTVLEVNPGADKLGGTDVDVLGDVGLPVDVAGEGSKISVEVLVEVDVVEAMVNVAKTTSVRCTAVMRVQASAVVVAVVVVAVELAGCRSQPVRVAHCTRLEQPSDDTLVVVNALVAVGATDSEQVKVVTQSVSVDEDEHYLQSALAPAVAD